MLKPRVEFPLKVLGVKINPYIYYLIEILATPRQNNGDPP